MENLPRDLMIGAAGSVLGAGVIYAAQAGFALTKKAQAERQKRLDREIALWKGANVGVRQAITNRYLFEMLRLFVAGTIFVSIPSYLFGFGGIFQALSSTIGLAYFYISMGKSLRYLRIRGSDDSYLSELEEIQK